MLPLLKARDWHQKFLHKLSLFSLQQGHCPSPEKRKSNSPLDKAIEEPSEIDVLTALFEMNGYLVDTVLG